MITKELAFAIKACENAYDRDAATTVQICGPGEIDSRKAVECPPCATAEFKPQLRLNWNNGSGPMRVERSGSIGPIDAFTDCFTDSSRHWTRSHDGATHFGALPDQQYLFSRWDNFWFLRPAECRQVDVENNNEVERCGDQSFDCGPTDPIYQQYLYGTIEETCGCFIEGTTQYGWPSAVHVRFTFFIDRWLIPTTDYDVCQEFPDFNACPPPGEDYPLITLCYRDNIKWHPDVAYESDEDPAHMKRLFNAGRIDFWLTFDPDVPIPRPITRAWYDNVAKRLFMRCSYNELDASGWGEYLPGLLFQTSLQHRVVSRNIECELSNYNLDGHSYSSPLEDFTNVVSGVAEYPVGSLPPNCCFCFECDPPDCQNGTWTTIAADEPDDIKQQSAEFQAYIN